MIEIKNFNIERACYIILAFGTLVDHISTRVGISHPRIYERNMFVKGMIDQGVWLKSEIVIFIAVVLFTYFMFRSLGRWAEGSKYSILFLPYLIGCHRLSAGLWNTYIYLCMLGYLPWVL